jgi:hypothetical protein
MKLLKPYFFLAFFLFQNTFVFAGNCVDEVSRKMGSCDAATISGYFDDNVLLNVPGSQSTYSDAQATMILSDFFEKYKVKNVQIDHRGGDIHQSQFAIGKVTTCKGEYRVYVSVKEKGSKCVIKELRFER